MMVKKKRTTFLSFKKYNLVYWADGWFGFYAGAFICHRRAYGKINGSFYVSLVALLDAGISTGFAEALSDDGTVTGKGLPLTRGLITGFATTFGRMLQILPFLIPNIHTARQYTRPILL